MAGQVGYIFKEWDIESSLCYQSRAVKAEERCERIYYKWKDEQRNAKVDS